MYSGVVINLLVEVHAEEDVGEDGAVRPPHIPVVLIALGLDLPVQLLGDVAHYVVLCVYFALSLPEMFITIRFRFIFLARGSAVDGFFTFLGLAGLLRYSSDSEQTDSLTSVSISGSINNKLTVTS